MRTPEKAPVIAIAGAGPVAQALGRALAGRGIDIAYVASRNPEHARAAAQFIGGGARAIPYREIPLRASHALIAVTDRAIEPVAEELAGARGTLRVALHTCGGYGPEPLSALAAAGVSCGTIHPLQTVRDPVCGSAALRGAAFAVSGDAAASSWAEELVSALGGRVLRIAPGARPLYHAAAVMASNYVAALLDCAERLMLLARVPKEDALPAIAPLARETVENALRYGALQALTGPIARGDAPTVARHLRALDSADPAIAELYRAAGLHALRMARERGLGVRELDDLKQALFGDNK